MHSLHFQAENQHAATPHLIYAAFAAHLCSCRRAREDERETHQYVVCVYVNVCVCMRVCVGCIDNNDVLITPRELSFPQHRLCGPRTLSKFVCIIIAIEFKRA